MHASPARSVVPPRGHDEPASIGAALRCAGLDPLDARLLLQHVLGVEHAFVIAHPERVLDESEQREFTTLAARRAAGEPIAYLIGWREFYGRRLRVDASVLIPRPETELLVELALERLPRDAARSVLDLGTGSGCIAITLGLERASIGVVAIDASPAALAIARDNACALGADRVRFVQGDWCDPLANERFDMIVANPPYVAHADPHLEQGDLRFEPRGALAAGPDGLACIRRIVAGAAAHMQPGAWLLFEHGYDHGERCRALLASAGYADVFTARDLAGLERVSGARGP